MRRVTVTLGRDGAHPRRGARVRTHPGTGRQRKGHYVQNSKYAPIAGIPGRSDRSATHRDRDRIAVTSQSVRRRAIRHAAEAWRAGKPHRAWEIMAEAGLLDHWREFQRTALRVARRRYLRYM